MAETRLKVVLETSGEGKLKAARKDSDQLSKALGRVGVESKAAANGIRLTGRAAQGATRGVKGLSAAFGQLALALGGVATATAVFNTAINRIESERRIESVAGAYGEAAQLADAAGRAAEKFGLGQTEANLALADTFARLKPLGTSLKDIESVYGGFNTAVKLSGVSAEEATSAFRQLNQALGSGVLRGDEFTRISEAIPSILITIADELGVTIGELKQLGSEGKLTSEVVVRALKRVEKEGADRVAESLKGPRQQLINLQNAGEDLAAELGRFLLPTFIDLVNKTTELVKELNKVAEAINKLPKPVRDTAAAFTALGIAIAGITSVTAIGGLVNLGAAITGIGTAAKAAVTQVAILGGGATQFATSFTAAGAAVTKTKVAVSALTLGLGALKIALAALTIGAFVKIIFDINAEINETNRLLKGGVEVLDDLEQKIRETEQAIDDAARSTGFWESILNEFILGVGDADGALQGLNQRLDEFIKKRNTVRSQALFESMDNQKDANREGFDMEEVRRIMGQNRPDPDVPTGGSSRSPKQEFPNADKFGRIFGEGQALDDALKSSQDIREQLERTFKLDSASTDLRKQQLQIEFDLLDMRKRINTEAEEGDREALNALNDRNARLKNALAIAGSLNTTLQEGVAIDEELTKELEKQNELWKSIETTIADGVTEAINGLIDGTQTLEESFANILKDIGKLLISTGVNQLTSLGFDAFRDLFRANGGPVSPNQPYIVGEQGPELVVPSTAGTVVSNEQTMAAMGRYVMASGGPGAKGGGSSAGSSKGSAVNVPVFELETQIINNVEYATVADVRAMGAQATSAGAKQGEARVMSSLMNSRARRSKLGL